MSLTPGRALQRCSGTGGACRALRDLQHERKCRLQCLSLLLQARGRARAENSVYSVVAKANSREVSREQLNENLVELMEKAIQAVQAMPEHEYRLKVSAEEGQTAPSPACCWAQPSLRPGFGCLLSPWGGTSFWEGVAQAAQGSVCGSVLLCGSRSPGQRIPP